MRILLHARRLSFAFFLLALSGSLAQAAPEVVEAGPERIAGFLLVQDTIRKHRIEGKADSLRGNNAVFIAPNDAKYHQQNCPLLLHCCTMKIELEEADKCLKPCPQCNPPSLKYANPKTPKAKSPE